MTESGRTTRIRYDEGCLVAHALNVIGDRWALLVVRELMFASKRFQVIRAGLPGISAAVLTQRLHGLTDAGIVVHDPNAGAYGLSRAGRELLPVLQAMGRWGAHHPGHQPRRFISPTALMISMTAMIDRQQAEGMQVIAAVHSGHEAFTLSLTGDGVLRVTSGASPEAGFVLSGDGNRLASAIYGPWPLAESAADGKIAFNGEPQLAQQFVNLFDLSRR